MSCTALDTCFSLTTLKSIAREFGIDNLHHYKGSDGKELAKAINGRLTGLGRVNGYTEASSPLKTDTIQKTLNMYAKIYEDFIFLGVFPIDSRAIYDGLRRLNFKKLAKTNKKLGVVWNTDVSTGPGKHWIGLFINFKKKKICYFDSLNKKWPIRVYEAVRYITKKNKDFTFKRNTVRPQVERHNCGVYVLHFILAGLRGVDCDEYHHKLPDDDMIRRYRYLFFE